MWNYNPVFDDGPFSSTSYVPRGGASNWGQLAPASYYPAAAAPAPLPIPPATAAPPSSLPAPSVSQAAGPRVPSQYDRIPEVAHAYRTLFDAFNVGNDLPWPKYDQQIQLPFIPQNNSAPAMLRDYFAYQRHAIPGLLADWDAMNNMTYAREQDPSYYGPSKTMTNKGKDGIYRPNGGDGPKKENTDRRPAGSGGDGGNWGSDGSWGNNGAGGTNDKGNTGKRTVSPALRNPKATDYLRYGANILLPGFTQGPNFQVKGSTTKPPVKTGKVKPRK